MEIIKVVPTTALCRTDGAGDREVFGISIVFADSRRVSCPDLSDCRHRVERLCRRLEGEDLEPENLPGLFEDFAVEMAEDRG